MDLVADLTLVLAIALVGAFAARRLGQPLIVGYVIAGIAVGALKGRVTAVSEHDIERLAEIGVALLLFSLGLELSFRELAPVRRVALAGAVIQILLTMALGLGLGALLGWPWIAALWFGALISLSSTVVALKTIQTQGQLGTLSSRVMIGILVVQDLAVVPLTIILPVLSDPASGLAGVATATLRAIVLLAIVVWAAIRVVPPTMAFVAGWNSRELFLLSTTAVALGIGYATFAFGLSLAIGAFLAGLVFSESEYAHQALSDVVPLRDLFGMLFFVSVGMLLDPWFAWNHIGTLLLVVVVVVVGKAVILGGVVRLFGYWNVVPLAVGLTLFQVGEFAFVLARVGLSSGALSRDLYNLVLNTAILTMLLTPLLSGLTPALYLRFRARRPRTEFEALNLPPAGLSDHIIVAGAGRVGRSIADALSHLGLSSVLVEFDDARVQQARKAGLPVIYGDATQAVVLEAAALARARAMVVTVPAFTDVRNIVTTARRLRGDIPVIARADGPEAIRGLYDLGVEEVASPEFEAGIEMTRQALVHLDVPAHDILRVASFLRRERYGLGGAELATQRGMWPLLGEVTRELDFSWIRVPSGSAFHDRTIADLRIRTETGASIVGILRGRRVSANPEATERLQAGDVVAVLGTRDQIARFERAAQPVVSTT